MFLNIALVPLTNTISKIVLLPRPWKITQPNKKCFGYFWLEIGSGFHTEKYGDMEIHFIIKLLWGYLQKVGCNKKYKNVLNSVIIDYFVHLLMFSQLFLTQTQFQDKKNGYAGYTVSGAITQLQIIWQCLYKFGNFLGIQQQKQKECN